MERCPLCQSRNFDTLYASNIPQGRRGAGPYECTSFALGVHPDIFRCHDCTLVFNQPCDGELSHIDQYVRVQDPQYLEESYTRRLTYERELERIERLTSGRDLLDVGCYAGFFPKLARERGWNAEGVEPSRWAAHHATSEFGLTVFNTAIEQFTSDQRYDVVTMWDVLEHLSDPVLALEVVHGLLKPGGLLVFVTHNLDAPIARLLRGRHPFFMEMHTIHLSNRTCDLLLEKTGFERIERNVHRRALRLEYLLSRLRRFGDRPAAWAMALSRILHIQDWVVWINFLGLESIVARARDQS